MRSIILGAVLIVSTAASADCYISPDARGSTSSGELCVFGDSNSMEAEQMVDPRYPPVYSSHYPAGTTWNPIEDARVIDDLRRRNRQGYNDGYLRQAVEASTRSRPIRAFRPSIKGQ